ncbi:MAG: DUF4434 domain-containing protein [Planctomycetaceae bacterium]|nr:DUF4434 domain-containing protein [Planctomycetaceae bacterium]
MQITGTFLDEISHDIPSANWGPEQWEKDFDAMKHIGIDTVIVIRAGYRNKATFNSKVIAKETNGILPVPFDLIDIFLDQAERCGMDLFFGTYDSGNYWMNGNYQKEIDINKAFADEVIAKYGHRKALKGWYLCHEIDAYNESAINVYKQLAYHLKQLKKMPTLISPYIHGSKQFSDDAVTLDEHVCEWENVFQMLDGLIDIVAFQDGNVDFNELPSYIAENLRLAQKYTLACWSNIETFSRDMPIKFPPIGWPELLSKMSAANIPGIEKLITFEFSHFMSPNSIYRSAGNLYDRYVNWLMHG